MRLHSFEAFRVVGPFVDSTRAKTLLDVRPWCPPGAGLLLMRVAAGGVLLFHGVAALTAGWAPASVASHILYTAMGALLVVDLWTPIVGALAAIDAALQGFFNPADAGFYVLLTTLAAALALLGPGAWSLDARLFGWRRVEIRSGNTHGTRREPRP